MQTQVKKVFTEAKQTSKAFLSMIIDQSKTFFPNTMKAVSTGQGKITQNRQSTA